MAFPQVHPGPRFRPCPRPEFHQLETFLAVVQCGSFAAAARQSGRTQAAVSQAIARLEDFCGADLFERRHGAPLLLTPVGEAVLPSARILLHTVDDLMVRIAATALGQSGILAVGFEPSLAAGRLSESLARFAKAYPDVRLRLVEAPFSKLQAGLRDCNLDIAITCAAGELGAGDLERERLWQDRLAVVVPVTHALASVPSLNWAQVKSIGPLLLSEGQKVPCGGVVGCEQKVSMSALLDFVANGIGPALVLASASVVRPDLVVLPIDEENSVVRIEAIWRSGDSNPLRHRLLKHLRTPAVHCCRC